jgi:hypothetical protein
MTRETFDIARNILTDIDIIKKYKAESEGHAN